MRLLLILAAIVQLRGWSVATTPPRATVPGADISWQREVDETPDRDLWFRVALPQALPREPQLVFHSYFANFSVFAGPQRVYEFHDDAARDRMTFHVVALPPDSGGKFVFVRIERPAGELYFGGQPLLVGRAELPAALHENVIAPFRADIDDIGIGALVLIIGVIAAVASQFSRRGDTRALLYFGCFAGLYGARLLADSHLPYALGLRAQYALYTTAWITYVINIPGWALARRLIGDGWKFTLRWQLHAFIAFAPIAIAADLAAGRPHSFEIANNVLVIIGGLNVLFNLTRGRLWRSLELRVVLAGSVVFMLAAFVNNLSALGLLPWRDIDETLAFLAFVAGLGFAATRNFLRSERTRLAIENELATAREIQQSILPTSMPDIAGLRFHAHYDPASSVAGDLYDFLPVDAHRGGAIVADVSGHGVPAALIASMMKIAVSSQSRLAHEPAALLREVNRTLRGQVRRLFVTATVLYFDMEQRCVAVANAGHPSPLLHRDGEVQEIGAHGVILGRFDAAYQSETHELRGGDRIVAYTDGVTEAVNGRGEAFGEERLRALIRDGASAESIAKAVRAWRDAKSEADDVTLLVVDVIA